METTKYFEAFQARIDNRAREVQQECHKYIQKCADYSAEHTPEKPFTQKEVQDVINAFLYQHIAELEVRMGLY